MKDWKVECEVNGYGYVREDKVNIWFTFDSFEFRQTKGRFPPKKLNIKNCLTPEAWIVYLMHNKHKGKYGYDKFNWTGNVADRGIFYCPEHGYFDQIVNGHLRESGCFNCDGSSTLTLEDVKARCVAARGDEYDYSQMKYTPEGNMITVLCREHGEFTTNLYSHLKGVSCYECYVENRVFNNLTNDVFKARASSAHNNYYGYELVDYKDCRTPVKIVCPKHGVFSQVPNYHLCGNGCQTCGKDLCGFTKTAYKNACKGGSNVYVFKISNDDEVFYKIGISKNVKNRRSQIICESGYSCDVVLSQFYPDAGLVYDLEKLLHREFNSLSYKPSIYFTGNTECFKDLNPDEVNKILLCAA